MYRSSDEAESPSPMEEEPSAIYLPVIETYRPGQNAFAIEKREAEDHRARGNAFYQAERLSATHEQIEGMSASATIDHSLHPSRRDTSATTFSQLIKAAKAEADIEALPSINTKVEASAESESKQKKRPKPLQLEVNKYGVNPTTRASIEAKSEKKLFQMMGEPTTPVSEGSNERYGVTVAKHDRTKEKSTTKKDKNKEKERAREKDGERSPISKKRFLGMNISVPNFRSERGPSSPPPDVPQLPDMPFKATAPYMPPKAAALLGSSCSPGKRSTLPQHIKTARSQSNVSMPIRPKQVSDPFRDPPAKQRSHTKPNLHKDEVPPLLGKQTSRFQELISTPDMLKARGLKYINEAMPPTPPAKDTPMLKKKQPATIETCPPPARDRASDREEATASSLNSEQQEPKGDSNDRGSVVVGNGQVSSGQPQYNLYTSNNYNAMMAKMSQVYSAPTYGGFGQMSDGYSPEPMFVQGRWSEGQVGAHHAFLQYHAGAAPQPPPGADLPPTFYTPSLYSLAFPTPNIRPSHNSDKNLFFVKSPEVSNSLALPTDPSLTSKPSGETIEVCFQGYRDEVTPTDDASSFWENTIPSLNTLEMPEEPIKSFPRDTQGPSQNKTPTVAESNTNTRGEVEADNKNSVDNAQKLQQTATSPKKKTFVDSNQTPQQPTTHNKNHPSSGLGLTPFLNQHQIDSPMMRRYNAEGVPHTSSAAPSPLVTHPASAQVPFFGPITTGTPLADGSNIITHFGVTNHHMDAIADTTYRLMETLKTNGTKSMKENHEAVMQALSEQFGVLLAQVGALENANGRLTGDVDNASAMINKIMDMVQKDLVRPLDRALKSNSNLESEVTRLGKSVADLEGKIDINFKTQREILQQLLVQTQQQQGTLTPNSVQPNGDTNVHTSAHYSGYGASNSNIAGHPQSAMSFPEWGGYSFGTPFQNARNTKNEESEKFRNYSTETNRMYGGQPDIMRNHTAISPYIYPPYPGYGTGSGSGSGMK